MFAVLTTALFYAIIAFARDWFTADMWSYSPRLALAGTAIAGLTIANPLTRWLLLPRMRRPVPQPPRPGLRVAAVTTYVPQSESLQMLEVTLTSMKDMEYPHDCWLLDEGDCKEAKELCRRLGVCHFSRKGLTAYQAESGRFQSHSKHGNYNAWLTEIGFHKYEIIAAFDPDHIPSTNFLVETLGYFDDERIGYVQAAQAYYNQRASFIAAGAAEETYDYYSTLQMAGYGLGFPIVIGCHNIHLVAALKEVGGFAPHDADDLLITMFYRAKNWRGVYVPAVLARGLTPVDWYGYLVQQRRWARSVLDIKLRLQPQLAAKLANESKLASYLHGLSYLQPSVMLLLVVVVILVVVSRGELPPPLANLDLWPLALLIGVLTICNFFRQSFYLEPQREWGLHARARLLRIAKAPFLLLACFDVLMGRQFGYIMTPKTRPKRQEHLLLVPFGMIACATAAAWAFGIAHNTSYATAVHILAAGVIVFCSGLVLSEYRRFPEPFDPRLLPAQAEQAAQAVR